MSAEDFDVAHTLLHLSTSPSKSDTMSASQTSPSSPQVNMRTRSSDYGASSREDHTGATAVRPMGPNFDNEFVARNNYGSLSSPPQLATSTASTPSYNVAAAPTNSLSDVEVSSEAQPRAELASSSTTIQSTEKDKGPMSLSYILVNGTSGAQQIQHARQSPCDLALPPIWPSADVVSSPVEFSSSSPVQTAQPAPAEQSSVQQTADPAHDQIDSDTATSASSDDETEVTAAQIKGELTPAQIKALVNPDLYQYPSNERVVIDGRVREFVCWTTPKCPTHQVLRSESRTCISHHFGRNKRNVKLIETKVTSCRIHYQRMAYRRDTWQFMKLTLCGVQANLIVKQDPLVTFTISLSPDEQRRLAEFKLAYLEDPNNKTDCGERLPKPGNGTKHYGAPIWVLNYLQDQCGPDKILEDVMRVIDILRRMMELDNVTELPHVEFYPIFSAQHLAERKVREDAAAAAAAAAASHSDVEDATTADNELTPPRSSTRNKSKSTQRPAKNTETQPRTPSDRKRAAPKSKATPKTKPPPKSASKATPKGKGKTPATPKSRTRKSPATPAARRTRKQAARKCAAAATAGDLDTSDEEDVEMEDTEDEGEE